MTWSPASRLPSFTACSPGRALGENLFPVRAKAWSAPTACSRSVGTSIFCAGLGKRQPAGRHAGTPGKTPHRIYRAMRSGMLVCLAWSVAARISHHCVPDKICFMASICNGTTRTLSDVVRETNVSLRSAFDAIIGECFTHPLGINLDPLEADLPELDLPLGELFPGLNFTALPQTEGAGLYRLDESIREILVRERVTLMHHWQWLDLTSGLCGEDIDTLPRYHELVDHSLYVHGMYVWALFFRVPSPGVVGDKKICWLHAVSQYLNGQVRQAAWVEVLLEVLRLLRGSRGVAVAEWVGALEQSSNLSVTSVTSGYHRGSDVPVQLLPLTATMTGSGSASAFVNVQSNEQSGRAGKLAQSQNRGVRMEVGWNAAVRTYYGKPVARAISDELATEGNELTKGVRLVRDSSRGVCEQIGATVSLVEPMQAVLNSDCGRGPPSFFSVNNGACACVWVFTEKVEVEGEWGKLDFFRLPLLDRVGQGVHGRTMGMHDLRAANLVGGRVIDCQGYFGEPLERMSVDNCLGWLCNQMLNNFLIMESELEEARRVLFVALNAEVIRISRLPEEPSFFPLMQSPSCIPRSCVESVTARELAEGLGTRRVQAEVVDSRDSGAVLEHFEKYSGRLLQRFVELVESKQGEGLPGALVKGFPDGILSELRSRVDLWRMGLRDLLALREALAPGHEDV